METAGSWGVFQEVPKFLMVQVFGAFYSAGRFVFEMGKLPFFDRLSIGVP